MSSTTPEMPWPVVDSKFDAGSNGMPFSEAPPDKTTIVFTLGNEPGALFKALSVFALRDINLTKLESRPVRGAPWEYLFYVEVEANRDDLAFGRSLTHLAEFARWTRVLGTYKGAERRAAEQVASTNPMP